MMLRDGSVPSQAGYRERAYTRYLPDAAFDHHRYAASYARRIDRALPLRGEWRCLDIACGYGNFLAYLRRKGVERFVGIDASQAAVSVAAREFGSDRVSRADAFEFLSGCRGTFDLISAIDFLEHLTKDELYILLDAMHGALAPGGLLLARVPNAQAPFGMAARYNDITHELGFTTGCLTDVLSGARFSVVTVWEDHGRPTTTRQFAHWLAWQCARFVLRCIDAAETGSWGDGVLTRNMWVLARRT
jgi:2-polyprenyl-3-methyl-5-hydroxy-6-metoxy-1,4-benzoquinol methylase